MKPALRSAASLVVLLALATAGGGCTNPGPDPDDPGSVALQLFVLAATDPSREEIEGLFDPDLLANPDVPLLDALDRIADSPPPEVLDVEHASDLAEAYVDLAVALPAEGHAVYSVKLRRLTPNGWRIGWFQGPGVEWPPRGRKDPGLTTSAPPGTP